MSGEVDLGTWLTRVQAEFYEMPGLRLTERQMQRLCGLDSATCAAVIAVLIRRGVLVKTSRDAYVRADAAA